MPKCSWKQRFRNQATTGGPRAQAPRRSSSLGSVKAVGSLGPLNPTLTRHVTAGSLPSAPSGLAGRRRRSPSSPWEAVASPAAVPGAGRSNHGQRKSKGSRSLARLWRRGIGDSLLHCFVSGIWEQWCGRKSNPARFGRGPEVHRRRSQAKGSSLCLTLAQIWQNTTQVGLSAVLSTAHPEPAHTVVTRRRCHPRGCMKPTTRAPAAWVLPSTPQLDSCRGAERRHFGVRFGACDARVPQVQEASYTLSLGPARTPPRNGWKPRRAGRMPRVTSLRVPGPLPWL